MAAASSMIAMGLVLLVTNAPATAAQAGRPGDVTISQPVSGTSVSVSATGDYTVTTTSPQYSFGGSLGHPVSDVRTSAGHDGAGSYREVSFDYVAGGPRTSEIRAYDTAPVVRFATTYRGAEPNAEPFPALSSYPHLAHTESFTGCFGSYQFGTVANAGDSPWLFFDDRADGFMISPAANFPVARMTMGGGGALTSGIDPAITSLPAGFTQSTMLVVGTGVNSTYDTWGRAMTGVAGKTRPANDATTILDKLGYWTDNGASYYYKYEPDLGYAGTLEAVKKDWDAKGIPMGYMQLDSWFYPKGPNAQWNDNPEGEYRYEAAKDLFPDGLAAFHQQLGVPLVTHARWVDPSSPYRSEYKMSGNVVIDPRFWADRMAYLKNSGVTAYEQDWLCSHAQPANNLTDRSAFLDDMAAAASANGLDMQYCMPYPRDFLQTTLYDNLTNMRTSNDRFESSKWDAFLYASRFASALGVWPWSDVFMSTERSNLVLSTLSAGPVGVGDPLGKESATNLKQVARPDGVIVKPDAPAVPTDQTYIAEADGTDPPMVAATYSDHGALRDAYVFAYARGYDTPTPDTVYQAEDATLHGAVASHDNGGYTGSGYADYQNASGDYVEWNAQVPTSGTHTLLFRYANGGSTNRPLDVTANGAHVATLNFAPTGGWTRWRDEAVTLQLPAGTSTVRATDTGSSGANIDYLGVSAGTVTPPSTQAATITPKKLGVAGDAYVYDYFTGQGQSVPAGQSVTEQVTPDGSYYVVAPVGRSGIAFLGDAGKYVSLGAKRIARLSDDGRVRAALTFAAGESTLTLHGYAPGEVLATVVNGAADPVSYDPQSGQFSVTVHRGPSTGPVLLTLRRS
jgi:hypothetical protein